MVVRATVDRNIADSEGNLKTLSMVHVPRDFELYVRVM
jgi:hypothetical protein